MNPVVERFVLHWGEMGSRWGVNRSIAQIHGLLYLTDEPMNAEQIAEALDMARSNVSNSLKELTAMSLVYRVPVRGDRREFFAAETDLWEIVSRIARARKSREIDPAIAILRECRDAGADAEMPSGAQRRLTDMLEFVEKLETWYEQLIELPKPVRTSLMALGGGIASLVPSKRARREST